VIIVEAPEAKDYYEYSEIKDYKTISFNVDYISAPVQYISEDLDIIIRNYLYSMPAP